MRAYIPQKAEKKEPKLIIDGMLIDPECPFTVYSNLHRDYTGKQSLNTQMTKQQPQYKNPYQMGPLPWNSYLYANRNGDLQQLYEMMLRYRNGQLGMPASFMDGLSLDLGLGVKIEEMGPVRQPCNVHICRPAKRTLYRNQFVDFQFTAQDQTAHTQQPNQ